MTSRVSTVQISIGINGEQYERAIEPRTLLSDFIRHEVGLTGTHVGCEHGVCGACTVQLDGAPVRSCLILAVQARGSVVRTVESLSDPGEELHPLQAAFRDHHALQCGFCTPGILMSLEARLHDPDPPTESETRALLSGNLCRCTGYGAVVNAFIDAHAQIHRACDVERDR
jgi:aerobic-type carbon monoxide dehydrogenase small subunit (CoxS/CutS family)